MSMKKAVVAGRVHAVAWNDAHHMTDEVEPEEISHRPAVFVSVGRLLKSDGTGVTLTMDIGEDGRFRGRTFVPRGMVIEEWDLGPIKPKAKRKPKVKEDPSMALPFGIETP